MRDRKIVVLGDVMLDEFVWGDVTRISPEAPVPVVDIRRESVHLGGAANVLANVVALGAQACVVGVVGNDAAGERLRARLKETSPRRKLTITSLLMKAARQPPRPASSPITNSWCVPIANNARPLTDATEKRILDFLKQALARG